MSVANLAAENQVSDNTDQAHVRLNFKYFVIDSLITPQAFCRFPPLSELGSLL